MVFSGPLITTVFACLKNTDEFIAAER